MSQTYSCRLCVNECEYFQSLYDEHDHPNDLYGFVEKYFQLTILSLDKYRELSGICRQCSRHVLDFFNFQKFVQEAQTKLPQELHAQQQIVIKREILAEADINKNSKDLFGVSDDFNVLSCHGEQQTFQENNIKVEHLTEDDDRELQDSQLVKIEEFQDIERNKWSANDDVEFIEVYQTDEILGQDEVQVIDVHSEEDEWNEDTAQIEPLVRQPIVVKDELELIDVQSIEDEDEDGDEEMPSVSGYNAAKNPLCLENEQEEDFLQLPTESGDEVEIISDDSSAMPETFSSATKHNQTALEHKVLPPEDSDNSLELLEYYLPGKTATNLPTTSEKSDSDYALPQQSTTITAALTRGKYVDLDFEALVGKYLKNIKCYECFLPVGSVENLIKHVREKHPQLSVYVLCCQRKFIKLQNLKQHLMAHENSKLIRCSKCHSFWDNVDALKKHMAVGHRKRRYYSTCHQCNKIFVNEIILRRHYEIVHNMIRSPSNSKHNNTMITCHICHKVVATTREDLEEHIATVHAVEAASTKSLTTVQSTFKCHLCQQFLFSRSLLHEHYRKAHSIVGGKIRVVKQPVTKAQLAQNHINPAAPPSGESSTTKSPTMDPKSQETVCHLCQLFFTTKNYLHEHYRRVHELTKEIVNELMKLPTAQQRQKIVDKKVFVCHLCLQFFFSRNSLRKHYRTVHNISNINEVREDPEARKKACPDQFKCTACGQVFPTLYALKLHSNTHRIQKTGDNYSVSGRHFKLSATKLLETSKRMSQTPHETSKRMAQTPHEKSHGNETGVSPNSCGHCPQEFCTRNELLQHQLTHRHYHSERPNRKCLKVKTIDLETNERENERS